MSGDKTAPKQRGRPFLPGNTGNPHGRPPVAICLTDTLRGDGKALAEMRIGKKTIRGTNAELVSQRLWALARSGNTAAIKILYDRCDGLAKATVEMLGAPEIKVRYIERGEAAE